MAKQSPKSLSGRAVKAVAVKKAAMKKISKPVKKAASAKKAPAKKPVATKKPVETKVKAISSKVDADKKKSTTAATKVAPAKKAAEAPAPKKVDLKKSAPAAPVKPGTKKDLDERVSRGVAATSKKPDATSGRAAASKSGEPPKSAHAPIRVEPKIIEVPQQEFVPRAPNVTLFSADELEVFRDLLVSERSKILAKARHIMEEGNIQIDKNEMMDEVDQASAMVEQNLTFRLLDRDRKLLSEIDHALAKIETGDYGYCEGTGEPIPKRRLELRPWCRHSVKYKEKLERMKKSGRGVVDEDEA
ncbi:MAG: TraR/DksA family transcriptional regulator [Deltaproteobacteria bacterium]|nr:TraR/DksA family transcriptional regulator [Deltaproteobacteria bacterium]